MCERLSRNIWSFALFTFLNVIFTKWHFIHIGGDVSQCAAVKCCMYVPSTCVAVWIGHIENTFCVPQQWSVLMPCRTGNCSVNKSWKWNFFYYYTTLSLNCTFKLQLSDGRNSTKWPIMSALYHIRFSFFFVLFFCNWGFSFSYGTFVNVKQMFFFFFFFLLFLFSSRYFLHIVLFSAHVPPPPAICSFL